MVNISDGHLFKSVELLNSRNHSTGWYIFSGRTLGNNSCRGMNVNTLKRLSLLCGTDSRFSISIETHIETVNVAKGIEPAIPNHARF